MIPAFGAWRRDGWIRAAIYCGGIAPSVLALFWGLNDQLGADPVRELEHRTGLWALRFLILSLAVTPLARFGGPNLLVYRRALGLVAACHAAIHLSAYIVFDRALDLASVGADIVKRPYITVGMLAILILIPLAVTSTDAMVRRLGAKRWRALHRASYVAAIAAVAHFLMSVKSWPPEPVIYAAIVAALLAVRLVLPERRRMRVRTRTGRPA